MVFGLIAKVRPMVSEMSARKQKGWRLEKTNRPWEKPPVKHQLISHFWLQSQFLWQGSHITKLENKVISFVSHCSLQMERNEKCTRESTWWQATWRTNAEFSFFSLLYVVTLVVFIDFNILLLSFITFYYCKYEHVNNVVTTFRALFRRGNESKQK